jgi:hypothetical protein
MSGRPKQKSQAELEAQVAEWNAKHRVCALVKYYPVRGRDQWETCTTNSEAWVLSGHTAVVGLTGKSGCFALDNIEPYAPVPDLKKMLEQS